MIAVVTGGSRGIGRAVVERLARDGATVHFTYRAREDEAGALVHRLGDEGWRAQAHRCDARDIAASGAVVEEVLADHGRLDVLVNNAGVTSDRLLALASDDDWSRVLETSLHGLFGTSRVAARAMMRQRAGRIVSLTSVSGVVGVAGQTNYSAAKAAIIGFTRSLAKEMAPWGVPVNAVAPGFVDTDMLDALGADELARARARVPMKRFATPDEIAGVVRFFAVDASPYVTGQTLIVDGGLAG